MRNKIIDIGNSREIILLPMLLHQLNSSSASTAEIEVDNGTIIIKPQSRQGWAEAAKQMKEVEDDKLISEDFLNNFDQDEWTW